MSKAIISRSHASSVTVALCTLAAAGALCAEKRPRAKPSASRHHRRAGSTSGSSAPIPSVTGRRGPQAFWITTHDGGRALVYPPRQAGKRPLAVMLHGMCDTPENECPWLAPAVTPHAWLVCPRASLPCRGGGAMWSAKRQLNTVDSAIAALTKARAEKIDWTQGGTLLGFSQGAYAAFRIARLEPGRWSKLLLIAARPYLDARSLRRQGTERVILAAGDYDPTRRSMRAAARRLGRQGYPARFISLGKVGHTFPDDMVQRMTDAVAWLGL